VTRPARLVRDDESYLWEGGQMLNIAGWGSVSKDDLRGKGVYILK
jgi:hypothetical protein